MKKTYIVVADYNRSYYNSKERAILKRKEFQSYGYTKVYIKARFL